MFSLPSDAGLATYLGLGFVFTNHQTKNGATVYEPPFCMNPKHETRFIHREYGEVARDKSRVCDQQSAICPWIDWDRAVIVLRLSKSRSWICRCHIRPPPTKNRAIEISLALNLQPPVLELFRIREHSWVHCQSKKVHSLFSQGVQVSMRQPRDIH